MSVEETDTSPPVGSVIAGKYRVEGTLGAGGMGVVVRAHHTLLDQKVALKFLLPAALKDAVSVERFLREARAAVKLESEHVARILDLGTLDDGAPFIVMELLDGIDLGDLLMQRGSLPITEAVDYVLEALDAIAEAHARGIVHRDLKPSNLFCAKRADGTSVIKVLDFGISKLSVGEEPLTNPALTSSFAVIGSPVYMSPEQFRSSRSVDARGDIWSMGIILYQLLTGRNPFVGNTMGELFTSIITNEPIAPRSVRPDIPRALEEAILRCLRKSPDERYPSSGELAHVLSPFGSGRATRAVQRAQRLESAPPPMRLSVPSEPPPRVEGRSAEVSVRQEAATKQEGIVAIQPVSSPDLTGPEAIPVTTGEQTGMEFQPRRSSVFMKILGSIVAIASGIGLAYVGHWSTAPPKGSRRPPVSASASGSAANLLPIVTDPIVVIGEDAAIEVLEIDAGVVETIDVNALPQASPRKGGKPKPRTQTLKPPAGSSSAAPATSAEPPSDIFDRE